MKQKIRKAETGLHRRKSRRGLPVLLGALLCICFSVSALAADYAVGKTGSLKL